MAADPIRWGIIGCGDVCEVKSAPAYQQVEGFSLDAVMARTPGKAEDYAKRHQVARHYNDAQALIDDPQLDAIYIATPPDSHLDYALAVAKAGKICCVEKPMAMNYAQCQTMAAAFERAQKPLFVAYYRRSLAGFIELKTLLDNGAIGDVRNVSWLYQRPPSDIDRSGQSWWRTDAAIAPGGYFDDLACHGLDILIFLLGNVAHASGHCVNQQQLYTAYDAISAACTFESGATGTFNWNFASWQRLDTVRISGSEGSLEFSIFKEQDAVLRTADGTHSLPMDKPSPIQLPFVRDIARHLRGEIRHPSLAASAAHTSWVMDAILA